MIALLTGRQAHFADWDIGFADIALLTAQMRALAPLPLAEEFTPVMSPPAARWFNDNPPIGFPSAPPEPVATVGVAPAGYDGSA